MSRIVEFLAGARLDFDESFDWYANRRVGLAIGFASAVDDAIEKIVADPERFPFVHVDCRYCRLKRYPFRIIFREDSDRIVIVAVAHFKRRPGYWHRRIPGTGNDPIDDQ